MELALDSNGRARASSPAPDPTVAALRQERDEARAEAAMLRTWARRVADACGCIAKGDLEARLPACADDPDVGRMVSGMNRMLDITDAFVREAKAALTYASHGKFFRRVLQKGMPGTFRHAASVINEAAEAMHRQATALKEAEQRRIALADDFEHSVNEVVATLAASATEMRATAESLARMAKETTEQSDAVARAAEATATSVEAVATASEELSASARKIGVQIDHSTRFVAGAVTQAAHTTDTVGGLMQASTQIGHVVKLISEVAKQTNLLALNATIEAARSGEVGRGFAVVASEVKNLARKTSDATEQISDRIDAIQCATREGVEAIGAVGQAIGNVDGCFGSIALAIGEQRVAAAEIAGNVAVAARGTGEVSRSIRRVSQTARETDEAVAGLLLAAQDLSRQAEGLLASTARFVTTVRG